MALQPRKLLGVPAAKTTSPRRIEFPNKKPGREDAPGFSTDAVTARQGFISRCNTNSTKRFGPRREWQRDTKAEGEASLKNPLSSVSRAGSQNSKSPGIR